MSATAIWVLMAQLSGASVVATAPIDTLLAAGKQPATQIVVPPKREQVQFDASRFDSLTAISLRALFEDVAGMGLPTRPLINRALEGAARRATSERILRVVREHASALYDARQALGPRSTDDELDAGASALKGGLDPQMLDAVRHARPIGQAVVPLIVLTDIVKRGVPAQQARDAVTKIARTPRSDALLEGLQVTVAKNAQRGPGMALDALNRYVKGTVPGTLSPSTPATTDRKPVRPPDS